MRADLDDFEALLGDATPAPDTASAETLGELLGISPRVVREHASRGIIVKVSKGAYDVPASVRAYCTHLREQAAGRSASTNLTAERIRVAKEQADALAMKNAAARREMVPAREVESEWAAVLRDVRAAMLALPSRIQQRLPHLTAHDVATVDREIRDALTGAAE